MPRKSMFARPHLFSVPMKFYLRAQDIHVTLPGAELDGKLVLVWKRGPRRTQTEPFEVKEKLSSVDGSLSRSASTTQDLALICTMYKNAKTGAFESKSASFSLREEGEDGKEKKIGSAAIDLSSYATSDKTSERVELGFLDGKIRLHLTLTTHWLKSMNASIDDDDDSLSSSGISSALGGKSDEDQDLDVSQWTGTGSSSGAANSSSFAVPRGGGGGASAVALPLVGPRTERELTDAMRTTAIEARWNQEAERAERADLLEQARVELAQVRALYAASQKELKTIRAQAERLGSENRVLRRAQRGGKRDEVILQLETELYQEHHERADMEENLSRAFRSVLDDAHSRITLLTAERDRLMVALEEATGKKGGFALRK